MNNERVLSNEIVSYIERNYSQRLGRNEEFLKYVNKALANINSELKLIDVSGKLIFDSEDESISYAETYADIKNSIAYDKSFSSDNPSSIRFSIPIIIDKQQVGNAAFTLRGKSLMGDIFWKKSLLGLLPIFIGIIVILLLFFIIYNSILRDILLPISDLNESAESIAAGNLDKKIKYNDNSELGSFCSSFEFMRDELKTSLEKQQKLEQSRKELVACISHDLRTPIASIKAYVEGLQDGIAKDKEKVDKYVAVIAKKTESLVKLINDLFQHSQAELGELNMQMKECYSAALLNKIVQPISLEFKNSSINFFILHTIPDILVSVDSIRLEQVIMNLIQNAKKYTPEGGSIYFSARIDGEFLVITVKDTGWGISPRDLPFIFEKFYRGEKSRSRDYGGSGLGLSICKYIVEAHGGSIYVESNLEEGSKFSFTIPKL
jgi:signal transduction histidine kinase